MSDIDVDEILTLIFSSISLAASILIIVSWIVFPKLRSRPTFMVIFLAGWAAMTSIGALLGTISVKTEGSFCSFTAWVSSFSELGEALWTTFIMAHVIIMVHWPEKVSFKVEMIAFLSLSVGIPFLIATTSAGLGLYGVTPPADQCHYEDEKINFILHFGFIWLTVALDIAMLLYFYLNVVPKLNARERILNRSSTTALSTQSTKSTRKTNVSVAKKVGKTLNMYVFIFIIFWALPTIYRAVRLAEGDTVVWLEYLYVISRRSVPLSDCIIYGLQNHLFRRTWAQFWKEKIAPRTEPTVPVIASISDVAIEVHLVQEK